MRWRDQRQSSNVEDRRGFSGRNIAIGGGGLGTLVIIVLALLCGQDPRTLLQQMPVDTDVQTQSQRAPQNDDVKQFVASVLGSTEDAWSEIFQRNGSRYRQPKLVLYSDAVRSACGTSSSSVGPFYCPGDEQLYLDTAFFRELRDEFKAPGDFAEAYVIAHEVGHHVQNLLGTMGKVSEAQSRGSRTQANQYSVRLELQADCYAGIWAKYAQGRGLIETGDIEEALRAASEVGDDQIQKRAQGYVIPDSFTHGSARDRMTWFSQGFKTGDLRQCNTFGGK
ncbi:MAG TPA: neutral zinc metallopeptidase [Pyrinomonadaceae bacterium]|jgi:predicted metalloprotease|nr:neutral zinc metallopeptidase [Pyrinomonadaceae bacterium]